MNKEHCEIRQINIKILLSDDCEHYRRIERDKPALRCRARMKRRTGVGNRQPVIIP